MVKGFKKTEIGVIPEDWNLKRIEELTPQNKKNTIVDGPFGSNLKTIHYRKSGIPIITSGYVTNGYFFAAEYLYVDIEKFKQEKRSAVCGGDIVMAKIGERCGACAILPKNHQDGILSGNALKITIDEVKYSSSLIWQILYNNYLSGKLEILRTTGAQPALSMANLKKYLIPLPSTKTEQTLIAEALSDADTLISSLEKLIQKKRAIKQGAMQQLLKPKEGWVVKKLGEVCQIKKGQLITDSTRIQGNVPVIAGGKTPPYYHNKANRFGKTITISSSGASAGYIAFHSIPIFASDCSTIEESEKYCIEYVYFLLQLLQGKIFKMQTGGAQPHIHPSDLFPIDIPVPEIIEQIHIATVLSDMDAEIYALEEKLDKQKMIKQGMMQNLLTGKIRLI